MKSTITNDQVQRALNAAYLLGTEHERDGRRVLTGKQIRALLGVEHCRTGLVLDLKRLYSIGRWHQKVNAKEQRS